MPANSPPRVLVLGATGFTGNLIVHYLSTHPDRQRFTLLAGGRSKAKLSALVSALGRNAAGIETLQIDVTDTAELDTAIRDVDVVINTVGPFWRWGTEVVRSCVRHGVHYVDLTGEQAWVRRIILESDYAATKAHAIIIPACGMDSVPSDVLVHLSAQTLKKHLGPHATIGDSTTAFKLKGGVSGGTLSTVMVMLDEVPRHLMAEASKDWALSAVKGLAGPRPRLLYQLPHVRPPVFGSFFLMAAANKAVVQRTCGMHELAQRSPLASTATRAEARKLAYGPEFRYDEFMVGRGRVLSALLSLSIALGGFFLVMSSSVRWLFKKIATKPGDGPSPEVQKNGWIEATNVSSAGSEFPPTHVKSVLHGRGDPGYSLTAVMISECALAIALNKAELPAQAHEGGILTPVSALGGVLVRRLQKSGRFDFESAVIGDEPEGRKTR